jgi:DNA-binding GntR family transcriptional regulator
VLRQHGGILKAISMGSPAEAEALMAAHVADAAELVLRTLKKRAGNER